MHLPGTFNLPQKRIAGYCTRMTIKFLCKWPLLPFITTHSKPKANFQLLWHYSLAMEGGGKIQNDQVWSWNEIHWVPSQDTSFVQQLQTDLIQVQPVRGPLNFVSNHSRSGMAIHNPVCHNLTRTEASSLIPGFSSPPPPPEICFQDFHFFWSTFHKISPEFSTTMGTPSSHFKAHYPNSTMFSAHWKPGAEPKYPQPSAMQVLYQLKQAKRPCPPSTAGLSLKSKDKNLKCFFLLFFSHFEYVDHW